MSMKQYKIAGMVIFSAFVVIAILFSTNPVKVQADEPLNATFPVLMQRCYELFNQCNLDAAAQREEDYDLCDVQFFNDPAAHQSCYDYVNSVYSAASQACNNKLHECTQEMMDVAALQSQK
jgi:hypothetical protein